MNYIDLIDQIKTEARLKADDSFTIVAIRLLNEQFKVAVESQRPFELRAPTTQLEVNNSNGYVTLPEDFFLYHQVWFQDASTNKSWVVANQDSKIPPAPIGMYGHPTSYEINGQTLALKPIAALQSGDKVLLEYYKRPPEVTEATLVVDNPIPRLEPFLITSVVRRLRLFHIDDVQVAQLLQGDITAAANGYSKDEPERTT